MSTSSDLAERACKAFEEENWPDWREGQADNLRFYVDRAVHDAEAAGRAEAEDALERGLYKAIPDDGALRLKVWHEYQRARGSERT